MNKKIIIYFIVSFLIACKNDKKNNTNDSTTIPSEKKITEKELRGKSSKELRILRNEIFARKGYIFKDSALNIYFQKKDWYIPDEKVKIIFTDIEKENIKLIKEAEVSLIKFKIPNDYKIVNRSDSNGRPIEQIIYDFDGDTIDDVVSLGKSIKNDKEHLLFIYLSSKKKIERIKLNSNDDFRIFPFQLKCENGIIEYGFGEEGTSAFCRIFKLKFNPKIEKFQLINYLPSYRIMYGHLSKDINLTTGSYKVTIEKSRIDDTSNYTTTVNTGKHKTKAINSELINDKTYDYLDTIGSKFEEQ